VAFPPRRGPLPRPLRYAPTPQLILLLAAVLSGCAGAKPKQVGEDDNFSATPTSTATDSTEEASPSVKPTAEPKETWAPSPREPETGGLTQDQKAQMEIALRRGGEKAANCATVVPDAPRGEGKVKVLFDGKKGRCIDATVGAPFAGTPVESCIKRAFVGEFIVPFEGQLEVPYTIKLAPKSAEEPDKAKDGKGKKKK
jgi:hypothetical protein